MQYEHTKVMENFEEIIIEAVRNFQTEMEEIALEEMKEAWRKEIQIQMEQLKKEIKKNENKKDRIIGGLCMLMMMTAPLVMKELILKYPCYFVALSVTSALGFSIYKKFG